MSGLDKDEASPAVARAQQLLREKRYADALQVCNDELARGADDAELRLVAAQSLLAQGRQEGAKKEAQQAVRLDPTLAEAHRVLAEVACTRGELAVARDHLNRVLELDPDDDKSRALLDSLSRPVGATGAKGTVSPRALASAAESAPPRREDSAPIELGADDLEEDGVEEAAPPATEIQPRPHGSAALKPQAESERHVDPFSGETFPLGAAEKLPAAADVPVSDSMIVEMPVKVEAEKPERGLRTMPEVLAPPSIFAPPAAAPPQEVLFDGPTRLSPPPATLLSAEAAAAGSAPSVEDAWKPSMDAGAGSARKYEGTLRLPALDELPEEEEAPTMPLLRPSGPPKPQLRLDPMAKKPIEERPAWRAAPLDSTAPTVNSLPAQRPRGGPAARSAHQDLPGADDSAFEEFVEPASVPLRTERRPGSSEMEPAIPEPGRRPAAAAADSEGESSGGLLSLMAGRAGAGEGGRQPRRPERQHRPTGPMPPDLVLPTRPNRPSEAAAAVRGQRDLGDSGRRKAALAETAPHLTQDGQDSGVEVGGDGLLGLLEGTPRRDATPGDIERQIAAATSGSLIGGDTSEVIRSRTRSRGGSYPMRWVLVALIGLLIGGGGLAGYLYYDSWKYVQKEMGTLREEVYRSTPDGYRSARLAGERILKRRKNDSKALAALAMCDAAMSLEFGDDLLKSARELLERSKGTDSEWRTAATAFLALMEEPARADGYLAKGLEVYPDSALLHYLRGRALAASEAPDKAAEAFKAALKLAPRYVAAKVALVALEGQKEGAYDEAMRALDEIFSGDKDCLQALIERARLRVRHGKDLEEAASDARRVTGDLAGKAGRGQLGWAHLVLAEVTALSEGNRKQKWAAVGEELDAAVKAPPCCDSAFRYELGGELMKVHRLADAQAQMKEALALKPKQPEYVQRMARVLIELGEPAAALSQLQNAPARHPETRLLTGRALFAQGNYAKAADALRAVLAEDKQNLEAAIYIELCKARRGSANEAAAALEKLAAGNPKSDEPLKALGRLHMAGGDLAKAEAALKAAWKLNKTDPATPTLLGQLSMRRQDVGRAQSRFNHALEIRKEYRPARIGLSMLMITKGDLAGARAQVGLISEAERSKADVRALEVELELAEGKLDAARTAIGEAESAGLAAAQLHRLTGMLALAKKQGRVAEESFQKALKLGGKQIRDADLLVMLGKAQLLAGKVDDGYDTLRLALKEDAGHPLGLLELGRLAIEDGELGIALKQLTDALGRMKERGYPSNQLAAVYTALGEAHLKKKDTGQAIATLEDAMRADPGAADAQVLMGQTYDQLNHPDRAVQYYEKALQLDAGRTDVYELLGRAHAKLKDAENAAKYFEQYLRSNPPAARAAAVKLELQKLQAR